MNYIDEIFTRLNIQQIREFLLHGTEDGEINPKSYYGRINTAKKSAMAMLQSKFPDNEELEIVTDPVLDYVTATEEVYMEIGLQSGIILGMQILSNTKIPPKSED